MLVGELLKSVTGDDGYPGDTSTSGELARRRARHARHPQRALAQVLQLGRDRRPRPEAAGPVDARRAGHRRRRRLAVGAGHAGLARRGARLAGRGRVPAAADGAADPRRARPSTRRAAGRVEMTIYEESGHFPPLDARERWCDAVLRASWSPRVIPGAVRRRARVRRPARPRAARRRQITVFAREVADPDGREKPWLVYLQGGPGHESPRPTGNPRGPGWLDRALKDFRVLLLDQRGTGRSTPVTGRRARGVPHALPRRHDRARLRAASAQRSARRRGACSARATAGSRSSRYLSFAPDGLREAFITGGVPGIGVARSTTSSAPPGSGSIERNRRYYERYPAGPRADAGALEPRTSAADGDRLTRRLRTRQLARDERRLRARALRARAAAGLAGVQGRRAGPARARTQPDLRAAARGLLGRRLRHRLVGAARRGRTTAAPECFTAEHILPWMFEGRRWRGARADDARRSTSGRGCSTRTCCAATRCRSPRRSTPRTSTWSARSPRRPPRSSPNFHAWITNEYDHNGLRVDGERILGRLIDLARGRA